MPAKKRPERQADIKSRRQVYKGRYGVEEVVFDFDRVSGKGRILDARREIFQRGDSVTALIHDVERDVIVLAEQFRISTYDKGPGYLVEAVAGSVEEGEKPEACIRREIMEEVGYKVGKLTHIACVYATPGSSSERVDYFYAPVKQADLVDPGASGVVGEKEDIRRVEFSRADFFKRLEAGKLSDTKILVLGYWLRCQPGQGKPAKARRVSGNR